MYVMLASLFKKQIEQQQQQQQNFIFSFQKKRPLNPAVSTESYSRRATLN